MLLQFDLLGPQALPLLLVVAGLGLSIAEALAPGAHFIVIGVALLAAGLVGLLFGPLASPFVLSVLVLVFGGLALYGYREFDLYGGKGQAQTRDSDDLKGKTARVTERVTTGRGQVKVDGGGFNPHYTARTMDGEIAEGEEVLVVDPGGGNVVTVESLSNVESELDRELERARTENERRAGEETAAEEEAHPEDESNERETEEN
ncbi:MAG: NfeD family protein [Halolamina sp.]|uniref:NfeD family protein n=1 Tax=Halolamina sp. TaxID=1940283 RepID=UPI002FC28ED4